MIARVWGVFRAWRFRLFQRRRYGSTVLEWVDDRPFVVLPEVFNPGLFGTGVFLARQLSAYITSDKKVLDMGTGSGVGAVFAAKCGAQVTAVDINSEAVRCASINALLNHVEDRVSVLEGDLFTPVDKQRFDLILFNPPYYRGAAQTLLDHAWRSEDTVERFAAGLATYLNPGGYALVVLSTDGDLDTFLAAFRANQLTVEVMSQQNLISEIVTIYKLACQSAS